MKRIQFQMYYSRFANFGDLLNEYVIQGLFPVTVKLELWPTARMIGIGSILDRVLDNGDVLEKDKARRPDALRDRPMHVWGTGLMYPYDPKEQNPLRPLVVHALRGEWTRRQLSEILGRPVSCALGDPGILASRVLPATGEKRWELGLVPHFFDADDPIVGRLKEHWPDLLVINARDDPEVVLRQISQCRYIMSSSLHGLIVADSYKVPNCWCEMSDRVQGKGYKFHDYFSAFGTDREPFDLRSGAFPDPAKDFRTTYADERELKQMQKRLLRAFPYSLLLRAFWERARTGLRDCAHKFKPRLKALKNRVRNAVRWRLRRLFGPRG